MLRKIDTITWLLLAIAAVGLKFFLLPDTVLFQVLSIGFEIICGAGALSLLSNGGKTGSGVDSTKQL